MAIYTLEKRFLFEASHQLMHHDGKCRRLHGHSWQGVVYVEKDELETTGPKQGMVIDYGDISTALKPLIEHYLDHYHLNDTLKTDNPTSEEIAKWIFNNLDPVLPGLVAVRVEETCTSAATYRPHPPSW